MDEQIQEIKEAVELPLTHPEYFESLGIKAPKGSTMAVATLLEFVGDNHAIITLGKGESEWIVPILSIADRSKLQVNCNVLISLRNFSVVGVIDDIDSKVLAMKLTKAQPETFDDIGGMDEQIQEIKEAVELPLTHPEYFESLGIKAPKVKLI